jgi:hypothetical protein
VPVRACPTITIGGRTSAAAISGCACRQATTASVRQEAHELARGDLHAEVGQVRLLAQRRREPSESVSPRVLAQVGEAHGGGRLGEQLLGVEGVGRHRDRRLYDVPGRKLNEAWACVGERSACGDADAVGPGVGISGHFATAAGASHRAWGTAWGGPSASPPKLRHAGIRSPAREDASHRADVRRARALLPHGRDHAAGVSMDCGARGAECPGVSDPATQPAQNCTTWRLDFRNSLICAPHRRRSGRAVVAVAVRRRLVGERRDVGIGPCDPK